LEPVKSRAEHVERLFHEVLAIESGARDPYLADVCDGDEPLRRAVQKLLDAYERVGNKPA
jgi:hypothetical protein